MADSGSVLSSASSGVGAAAASVAGRLPDPPRTLLPTVDQMVDVSAADDGREGSGSDSGNGDAAGGDSDSGGDDGFVSGGSDDDGGVTQVFAQVQLSESTSRLRR